MCRVAGRMNSCFSTPATSDLRLWASRVTGALVSTLETRRCCPHPQTRSWNPEVAHTGAARVGGQPLKHRQARVASQTRGQVSAWARGSLCSLRHVPLPLGPLWIPRDGTC